jgi:hypothetical protein
MSHISQHLRGKTIKLFLYDGTPAGIIIAELMNWTGKVFVVPRAQLAQVKARPELNRAGAYLLVGDDPEVLGRLRVYVGEAETLVTRLLQHENDDEKAFYSRAVFITSKDDALNKQHARWLERRLLSLVKANGSVLISNGTAGAVSVALSESDLSDMEGFIDQVALILPSLGFTFIQPKPAVPSAADGASPSGHVSPVFELTVAGATARAQEVDGQFFLLGGSKCRRQGVPAWTSYKALRERLVQEGKIGAGSDEALLEVKEDIPLGSPSAAAAIVAGRNMNGRISWKADSGITYQDWVTSST